MFDRRKFIKQTGGAAAAVTLASLFPSAFGREFDELSGKILTLPPSGSATDEDFWGWVRHSYTTSSDVIYLNNGGICSQPKVVQDAVDKYNRFCNEAPSYNMWETLDDRRESIRTKVATLAGCSTDEIAFDRNATEALNTIIFGLNLKAGDEVVLSKQDYPYLVNAFKQREQREGIKLIYLDFNFPLEDEEEIVKQYEQAFTDKTRVVLIMHMINFIGQIMPVKAIAKVAHRRGIEVIVDGAQTFCQIDYKVPDLDCDYYGTSLHKFLCAPFGTGMLYIKKEKIKNIWPLLSSTTPGSEDIRKFEQLGTRFVPAITAIGDAVDFHNIIGTKRKEERIRYLKNYCCDKIKTLPKVKMLTSSKPEFSCGLATFSIKGQEPEDIGKTLREKYNIYVTYYSDKTDIKAKGVSGVRISPNVFNSLKELDKAVEAITEIASI